MARKKGEIQLLREIETQEEWEEVMAMEGLWVVDVYQEWCGPCQALVGHFRRLKNELGDNLLNFAMAKADTIDALEKYRGRCEPTFLFFAGGILTSYIHGANAPKVQKVITEQLASEHKILEGAGERKEVRDPVITRAQEIEIDRLAEAEALRISEAAKYETKEIGFTVAIIKPDAVAQGKIEEIVAEIKAQGIDILAQEEKELTFDQAEGLNSSLSNEPYFDDLIKFMTSGPSYVMLLTRGDSGMTIIKDWRDMIGPNNVEQAKEEAPASLRAKYGEKGFMNALHGSSSKEAAARERAFFFPNYNLPTFLKKKENIQRTLAIIRPEAFATKKSAILQKITEAGFKIAMLKEVQLIKEQAAEFYKEHEQYAYFDSLVENMCCGPLLALGLVRDDAIKVWRDTLGPSNIDEAIEKAPHSMRAQFPGASGMNQFHGSETEEAAKEELAYFFPMEQTVAVIKPDAIGSKEDIIAKIHEAGFRIAAQKETDITPHIAEILYPSIANKPYFDDLINFMTSGSSMFMVLSREGAVSGWRQEMGDVDPEVDRNKNPDSLRAEFGKDILHNAVHGSSNLSHAKREMNAIFGDLKFNNDGTVRGFQPDLDETAQVIERDRTSEAGDDVPEYPHPDAAQEDTAGEAQDILDNETNNAVADTPEDDTQTDTAHQDDKEDDGHTDHTKEKHKRHSSDHGSEKMEAEKEESSHQKAEGEHDKEAGAHEHHGSDHDSEKMGAGHHDEEDKVDHTEQENAATPELQGSDHNTENVELETQDGGYHGGADTNDYSQQGSESAQIEDVRNDELNESVA